MSACPAYEASGEGAEALVFLHGIGGDKASWVLQRAAFDGRFRVIAWDMPGYGDSAPLPEMTFGGLSRALGRLLDHLGLENAHVVGHSMGGMVAQEFVAANPGRVASLVLSCTSPAFGRPGGDWQEQFLAARLKPIEEGKVPADLAPDVVAGMVGDGADPDGIAAAIASMSRIGADTYAAALRCLVTFDGRQALAAIAAPTLVLAAEKDTNAPPEMMARMAEKIAGSRYHCIEGAGHLANLERPAAFNQAVLGFLSSVEG